MSISKSTSIGDKLYYPSTKGIALICEVKNKSEKDVLVDIGGKFYYIPNDSIDLHAIRIEDKRSKVFVTQRIEDPENTIVYLRYVFRQTWIDRLYNWYCKLLKRKNSMTIFPGKDPEADGRPSV